MILLSRLNWPALLAAAPVALLAWQVHLVCGFVYSIDDPYIHLALARQILHGHYGINPGEFSAPSSSILWPFLLAPLTFTRVSEFLPLVLNLGAVLVAVWWLQRWLSAYLGGWSLLATVALALALNLYGLALSGMENSWQVTFTIIVAISLVQWRIGWPFWLSVILLPLFRYEGLAISLPALACVFLTPSQRLKAIGAGAIIAAAVGGFSLFLWSHGFGFLPSSVLAKTGIGFLGELRKSTAIWSNIQSQFFFLVLAVAAAIFYAREGRWRTALLLVAAPTLLHLMFGRHGWFGRYHIYFAAWIAILFFDVFARTHFYRWKVLNVALLAALAFFSGDEIKATITTPLGSRNIHDQQRQMGLILRDHFDEAVAVNDLGFTSLYARRYVLDLGGLASYEALRLQGDPAPETWIARLMAEKKVEHAMVYPTWFKALPGNWVHVATLHMPHPWVTVANDRVGFYSTSPEAAARFRTALEAYRRTSAQAAMMLVLER